MVLNKTVQELHPDHLDLLQLSEQRVDNHSSQLDQICNGLLKYYSEKFMFMSQTETQSLRTKVSQFKALQKKALMIIFLFNNILNLNQIRKVVNVYMLFQQYCQSLQNEFKNSYKKISDYENISHEILNILVFICITNIY